MKGLVFTEFFTMIEEKFGIDMVDDLIDATDLESGGAYTAVGTYDHQELVAMVVELSNRVNIDVPILVNTFGHHLANTFTTKFSSFFEEVDNTLDFLKTIDNHIHVEVAKLYPDAELPEFTYDDSDPDRFVLTYRSRRGFADLAQGLIEATMKHYQDNFMLERSDSSDQDTHIAQFILTR